MPYHGEIDQSAELAERMTELRALKATLRRIEELATDTPTKADETRALDAIRRECEGALPGPAAGHGGAPQG